MGPGQYPQCAPVLTSVRRLWAARYTETTEERDTTTDELDALHKTYESRSFWKILVRLSSLSIHTSHFTGLCGSESKSSTVLTRRTLVGLDWGPTVWVGVWEKRRGRGEGKEREGGLGKRSRVRERGGGVGGDWGGVEWGYVAIMFSGALNTSFATRCHLDPKVSPTCV